MDRKNTTRAAQITVALLRPRPLSRIEVDGLYEGGGLGERVECGAPLAGKPLGLDLLTGDRMALSDIDRNLLDRCLARKSRAWEDFVDRYTGLVIHVVNHTARCRSIMLSSADREDLTAEVFLAIIQNDFAVLRHFRGKSSLATYLTVIARRVVVRKLVESRTATPLGAVADEAASHDGGVVERITDRDEVEQLLDRLDGSEAAVVRMYHLEGKTYQEISGVTGMPQNSVGPMLSRARAKLRAARQPHA